MKQASRTAAVSLPVKFLPPYPGAEIATDAETWLHRRHAGVLRTTREHCRRIRDEYTVTHGFPVLTHNLCEWIGRHEVFSEATTFVGVGSGPGALERELRIRGYNAIATDPYWWEDTYGFSSSVYPPWEALRLDHRGALRLMSNIPQAAMILSWPSLGEDWPEEAVREYTGSHLVYIGEGQDGCTGSDAMHDALEELYEEVDAYLHGSFFDLHDSARIYERRRRQGG